MHFSDKKKKKKKKARKNQTMPAPLEDETSAPDRGWSYSRTSRSPQLGNVREEEGEDGTCTFEMVVVIGVVVGGGGGGRRQRVVDVHLRQ